MDAFGMTAQDYMAKFGHSFRIYNHCTDKNGILRVKTLCDLLNDVAEMHTIIQHADVATLNKGGHTWMLRRMHLCMPDMPSQGRNVCVETWNPEVDGLLVPRLYKVSDEKDGLLRAFAYTDWMMVNLHTMRPDRPTEAMKAISGLCSEQLPPASPLLGPMERKTGFRPDATWSDPFPCRAVYSDIDFNGHLTQSSYIQRMIDAHGAAFLDTRRIKEMEVVYAREIKPDAGFLVRFKQEGASVSYVVTDSCQTSLHAWARAVWA